MGASVKKLGAPVQPEVGRKLVVLSMLIRQAAGKIGLIDLCRAVAQMSDVERAGLVSRGASENDAEPFVAEERWTIG
jgi:hypothetical protein